MDHTAEHRERCARDQRKRWWKDGRFCAAGGAVAGVGVSFSSDWDPWLCAGIGGVVLGLLGAICGLGSLMWVTVVGFRDGSSTRTQGWCIRLGPPA